MRWAFRIYTLFLLFSLFIGLPLWLTLDKTLTEQQLVVSVSALWVVGVIVILLLKKAKRS